MPHQTVHDWSSVDWSLSTLKIAEQAGLSASSVSRARRRLAPETLRVIPAASRAKIDWSQIDWTLGTIEIACMTGKQLSAVSEARRRFAPETMRKTSEPIEWSRVDWSLTTSDIAIAMGVRAGVVSVARRRHAPDTLTLRSGPTAPPKRGRGQPKKEPTQQIRAYSADVPRLMRHGKTQAEAVRNLLGRKPVSEAGAIC